MNEDLKEDFGGVHMSNHVYASVYNKHWFVTVSRSEDQQLANIQGIIEFDMLDKVKSDRLLEVLRSVLGGADWNNPGVPHKEITVVDDTQSAQVSNGENTRVVRKLSITWDNISPFGWVRPNELHFVISCLLDLPEYNPLEFANQEAWIECYTETVCRRAIEHILSMANMKYSDISSQSAIWTDCRTYLHTNSLVFTLLAAPGDSISSSRICAQLTARVHDSGMYTISSILMLVRLSSEERSHVMCGDTFEDKDCVTCAMTVRCDHKICISGVDIDTFLCHESQFLPRDYLDIDWSNITYYDPADSNACKHDPATTPANWQHINTPQEHTEEHQVEQHAYISSDDSFDYVDVYQEERESMYCPYEVHAPPKVVSTWGPWNTFFACPDATSQIVDSLNSAGGYDRQHVCVLAEEILAECASQIIKAFDIFK